jgi:hypothetical protein
MCVDKDACLHPVLATANLVLIWQEKIAVVPV